MTSRNGGQFGFKIIFKKKKNYAETLPATNPSQKYITCRYIIIANSINLTWNPKNECFCKVAPEL